MQDKQLRKRISKGDMDAFVELYDQFGQPILRYLTSRLGQNDAQDVLQNVFTRLFRYHRKLAKSDNLPAYLFMTARNEANRFHSKTGSAKTLPLTDAGNVVELGRVGSEMEAEETSTVLLNQLDEAPREIVQLKIFSDLTFKEVGKILSIPEQTAASRYRRAIEKLKVVVSSEKAPGPKEKV